MLDSFDASESSEDAAEDNEEQRYLTTANDQLHSYAANKTADACIIVGSVPIKYNVFYYGIIADCSALSLILNFISHTGYFCCFYCFIKGKHDRRCRKRQYIYSDPVCARDPTSFNNHSQLAESNKLKVYGHHGRSILDGIIDIPLPYAIICDYQHVILLRHFRDVIKAISCSLPTKVRKQIEQNHFAEIYQRHGSLAYINTFSQVDFIGYISSNRNGTRHLGDLILHYYNIDMYLSNHKSTTSSSSIDQGLDIVLDTHYYKDRMIVLQHAVCSCSSIESCIKFFKRCAKHGYIYHSLLYKKGGNSNNLFVQFSNNGIDLEFGEIAIFFQQKDNLYACIRKYNSKYPFSAYFEKSKFYNILHEPLEIVKHCVVFLADDDKNCVIVTPISFYDEHD
ncbi:unnamed protein product [Rotaria socialis]|uniref:Uncharacterized protein n=1 Tax=Rotaria socialis TaxID=392032 RepID=A0A818NMV3_9BILA|nr:unnamed protein product [Rotaria socialis]